MTVYAALLRAVNVGGTGKLPMKALVELCESAGFSGAKTYIQSGNVVFSSRKSDRGVKSALGAALAEHMGKPVGVLVRSAAALAKVAEANPFPDAAPNRVLTLFLDAAPDPALLAATKTPGGEVLVAGAREVYIHFPDGMGKSRLKVPHADIGTARNLNTVNKLVQLAAAHPAGGSGA